MQGDNKKKKGEESLYFLRDKVYPDLYESLIQLIDHIVKTDEIRKHQERLKKKKVFDKLEQRKIDKERLKAELESDYESSDEESIDFEELGLGKEELDQILAERQDKRKDSDSEDDGDKPSSTNNVKSDNKLAQLDEKLGQIQEDEENAEEEEDDQQHLANQRQKAMDQLKKQREEDAFNPLKFLAQRLKEVAQQRREKNSN